MSIYNRSTKEETHKGMVLHVRGTFKMDMSMDEVLIWDPSTKSCFTKTICGDWYAEVDASDEVKAQYYKLIQDTAEHYKKLNAEARLKDFHVGCEIKVVRGRKVPLNTVAKVTSISKTQFGDKLNLNTGISVWAKNCHILVDGSFTEAICYYQRDFYFQAI